MHEMALAEGILGVVLEAAEGKTVKRIRLSVGQMQMVVPDSLEFSFQLVAAGTPAAEAELEMEEIPARLRCKKCRAESDLDFPSFNCNRCGDADAEIVAGDELLVDAVELENGVTIQRRAVPTDEILEEHLKDHEPHDHNH